MIEFVADQLYATFPQKNVHFSAPGTQESPVTARLADGGFVVGWISNSDFLVQRYNAQGARAGTEQLVASGVRQPALVGMSGGGFAAAWSAQGIYARTFDASGTAISDVFTASTSSPTFQMQQPALGSTVNDGLIIAWSDSGGNGVSAVKARVFDGLGAGVTGEIVVAGNYPFNSYFPKVSVQADGDFVVAWTGSHTAPSGEIFFTAANARVYDVAGNPKSGVVSSHDFQSVPGFHDGFYQSITTLKSGGFVMTWTDRTGDGDTIRGQLYGADGTQIGAQFQVNPPGGLGAGQSAAAALDNGGFTVTWRPDTNDGGPNYFQHGDILAQTFDASGAKVGNAFLVNDITALGQDTPAVASFGSGDFAVIWRTWTGISETDVAIKLFFSAIGGTSNGETLIGTSDTDYINGLGGDDILIGLGSSDRLDGGADNDTIDGGEGDDALFSGSGTDVLLGGDGDDGLFFGAFFDADDSVDGGAGSLDQVGLQGDYSAGVTLSAKSAIGVEQYVMLPGSDTRFGAPGNQSFSYSLVTGNAAIAAGQQLVFQANTLSAIENFTLDASAELDGSVFTYGGQGTDHIIGGQGGDAFFFGTGRFNVADVVDGQGGIDQIGLQGSYSGDNAIVLGAGQIFGVEAIVLLTNSDPRFGGIGGLAPYSYDLTTNEANVASGQRLAVQANLLASNEVLRFNGAAETDGSFLIFSGNGNDVITGSLNADTISGRGGADTLTGGSGSDVFLYTNLFDSTVSARDIVTDFTTGDTIDLSRIDAIVGGNNDAFTLIGSATFSNVAGQLRVSSVGGNIFAVDGDINGDGTADFSLYLANADAHPLTSADFVL